jgi:hypothetical protein
MQGGLTAQTILDVRHQRRNPLFKASMGGWPRSWRPKTDPFGGFGSLAVEIHDKWYLKLTLKGRAHQTSRVLNHQKAFLSSKKEESRDYSFCKSSIASCIAPSNSFVSFWIFSVTASSNFILLPQAIQE